jgi:hypothetical protein
MLLLTLGIEAFYNFSPAISIRPLLAYHPLLLAYNDLSPFPIQTLRGVLQPHAFLAAYFTVRSAFLPACSIFPASRPLPSHLCLPPGLTLPSHLYLPAGLPLPIKSLPTSSQSSLPASWTSSSYHLCLPLGRYSSQLSLPTSRPVTYHQISAYLL